MNVHVREWLPEGTLEFLADPSLFYLFGLMRKKGEKEMLSETSHTKDREGFKKYRIK